VIQSNFRLFLFLFSLLHLNRLSFVILSLGKLTDKPAVHPKHSLKFDFNKSLHFIALYVRGSTFSLKLLQTALPCYQGMRHGMFAYTAHCRKRSNAF